MSTSSILENISAAWNDLQDSYAGLTTAQLLIPGAVGEWSVRDILAHVTTWEQEALDVLPLLRRGERLPRYRDLYGGINAFNALMTERKRGLSLDEVLAQHQATHRALLEAIAALSEEQAASGSRIYRRLHADTWGHYAEHARAIRAWRMRQGL